VASQQTQRTYDRAGRAFTAWLGPLAGPEDVTAANVAAYHAELVRSGRASSTVRKERASRAIVRWERQRAAAVGAPARGAALLITLGRRNAAGSYASVGRRCGLPALAAVIKRLGALAKIAAELCHPHALRHTCATGLLRTGASIADVRTILGHASVKTMSVCLACDQQRQEDVVARRERGGVVFDEDRDGV
jgi:site-specific recombinase XerD